MSKAVVFGYLFIFIKGYTRSNFVCSKDVRLPFQLQRAMAAEAEAAREAKAKVRLIVVYTLMLPVNKKGHIRVYFNSYIYVLTTLWFISERNSGMQGSVNIHRSALLLVPQWRCISSFVFYFFCILHWMSQKTLNVNNLAIMSFL